MSINYAREILRISLSQICNVIGFDSISEICLDILIDICEKQFQFLFKQISNQIQFIDQQSQLQFPELFFLLFENDFEDLHFFNQFIRQFQSIQFNKQIIRFPYRKKNQIYLRIPSQHSNEIRQRQTNENTQYIYDWLPLFPHQETPEDLSQTNSQQLSDENLLVDQHKNLSKDSTHHPLTLLSLLTENNGETNQIPIGIKPKRSLPKIVYRPRRLIEIDAATAAAEKAKKDLLEKENIEKEQSTSQPPLRLTISKPLLTDKPSSPVKKFISNQDKKSINTHNNNNNNNNNINNNKKIILSPNNNNNQSNESISTNIQTNSNDTYNQNDKIQQVPLDLTKPSTSTAPTTTPTVTNNKLLTLKLNIKNVNPTQPNNNSENPTTATKKSSKSSTNNPEKVNLKIRTSSSPLFATNPPANVNTSTLISPIIHLPNETMSNNSTTIHLPDENLFQNRSINQDETKKKKKKKHEHESQQKKLKKEESQVNDAQVQPMNVDFNTPVNNNTSSSNPTTSTPSTPSTGGAIKLTIKLAKPPTNIPTEQNPPTTVNQDNPTNNNPTPTNTLKLKLTVPSNSSANHVNKKKSIIIKDIQQKTDLTALINEDNTNSIDDLPLVARTSPSKITFTQLPADLPQDILVTPVKKQKNPSNKRKSNAKKQSDIGVAVIEERRIDHDSQEKIWICPSCNRPDNGQEAMIACDLCDDWYHWECVGIAEEPPESTPWFCPKCHRSNSSTTSAQSIKPSASSKAKRQRASILYQQKQKQKQPSTN